MIIATSVADHVQRIYIIYVCVLLVASMIINEFWQQQIYTKRIFYIKIHCILLDFTVDCQSYGPNFINKLDRYWNLRHWTLAISLLNERINIRSVMEEQKNKRTGGKNNNLGRKKNVLNSKQLIIMIHSAWMYFILVSHSVCHSKGQMSGVVAMLLQQKSVNWLPNWQTKTNRFFITQLDILGYRIKI